MFPNWVFLNLNKGRWAKCGKFNKLWKFEPFMVYVARKKNILKLWSICDFWLNFAL